MKIEIRNRDYWSSSDYLGLCREKDLMLSEKRKVIKIFYFIGSYIQESRTFSDGRLGAYMLPYSVEKIPLSSEDFRHIFQINSQAN